MKKIYGFYRKERINNPYNLEWNISLNWNYSISFFVNNQYADYIKAWIIRIKDMEISTDRYIKEIVPWIKDLREFVYMEYEDTYIDLILATTIITKVWSRFDLELLDIENARQFIRNHTNLEEIEIGKFLLNKEIIWINWEITPEKLLIID